MEDLVSIQDRVSSKTTTFGYKSTQIYLISEFGMRNADVENFFFAYSRKNLLSFAVN
jgi:hypothetical protein